MPANPSGIKGISTLFSFTPRQVLLNTPTMKHGADNGTIISEQKVKFLLHQSIALYLEHSGFSKTLKKFISEAKIEKDNTEGSSVDLEEMCRKFLETCNDAKSTINGQKEQGVHSKNEEEKPKEKKKKKSKLVSEAADNMEDNQLESLPMVPENKVKDDLSTDAKVENGAETEKQSKRKTKKKGKSNIEGDSVDQITVVENNVKDELSIDAKVENGAETEKRSKHKMKKKDKSKSEGDAKEQIEDTDAIVSEKENFEASNEEATPEAKKDSKKRKRPISKENGEQDTEIKADEETKRRKIENLNGETDVHPGNGAAKSSVQSSQKKKHKESVEPKPANTPFQRVQVDKIDFVDERLQDNSYWAKDGAESGYGAKAQEILGQVRGRDFRHEKTKKKRGTYRGGFIDLQSHSVKFNVSDEE
ncbi:uncharacterized protein [Cicer arietinum]|uniref:Nucleolar and coiled-body phosphoprotein 1 isoform X2 n=1 Tax=Cicer arietinum TaxID=3827 RepID=A0A1S2YPI7_CICAR|nr:nucleolar and coiled-body phosphoprotein 1 isoform X2 [Cicer arietinum]